MKDGPLPDFGRQVLERELPSDLALVTPTVIRVAGCLRENKMCSAEDESRMCLCLAEALRNAVVHGNGNEFGKKVKLQVFAGKKEWSFVVHDEGAGFDPTELRDPTDPEGVWDESGRGLFLVSHYMDSVTFYDGGRTLVAARSL